MINITWVQRRGQIKHLLYEMCLKGRIDKATFYEQLQDLNRVEPVVRCKDCKYYCKSLIDEVTNLPMCGAWSAPQKQDGFCNYGERKDEVEE